MPYTKKVEEYFGKVERRGVIKNPSGQGEAGNAVCGDVMQMHLRIKNGVIREAKYRTFGCAAAVATVAVLCEMIEGMKVVDAKELKFEQVVEKLGGLPKQKLHCASLAITTLQKAIADYEKKQD